MADRARPIAGTVVAIVALMAAAIGPVGRPPVAAAAGVSGSIELVSQSAWVDADGTFEAQVAVTGPRQSTVEITVHPRVLNRISFQNTIASGPRGVPVYAARTEPIANRQVVSLEVPLTDTGETDHLTLSTDGVYPVEISLLDIDGTRIDRFTTHLVRADTTGASDVTHPLAVALTLPLHLGVALNPDGTSDLDDGDAGAFTAFATGLASHIDVPATVSIPPEAAAALDERPANALRAAVDERQLLIRPYVDVDPTAWLDAGLDSEWLDLLAVGAATTVEVIGRAPDPELWLAGPDLTPGVLATLGGLGYDTFVFRDRSLEPLDATSFPLTLTQQFLVEDANGQRYRAASIDETLADRFPRGAETVLAAAHTLAELAVLAADQPAIPRGVIVAPPVDWVPDATFLRIVLGGLDGHPLLRPVDLTTWFDDVSVAYEGGQSATLGFHLDRELVPTPAEDLSEFAARYTAVAADAFSLGAMMADPDGDALLIDLLRVAGAGELSAAERSDYLDAVEVAVAQTIEAVVVRDPPERVTFAARDGDIPLVIDNTLTVPVSALLTMASDKLEFPDGSDRELELAPGRNEISLAVAARTSGDSILDITLTSPDRSIHLASTTVTVRSTAFSGAAVIIAVVALAFLLVWWIRTRRDRARDARLVPEPTDDPGNVGQPQRV